LTRSAIADLWSKPAIADEEEVECGTRRQRRIGRGEHLFEATAFGQLSAENGNRRVKREPVMSANGSTIDGLDRLCRTPNRGDEYLLLRT
jgi:hypothetical protein